MKRAGSATIAQDEKSCVVFGMPKEAISAGAVDTIAPLAYIPKLMMDWVNSGRMKTSIEKEHFRVASKD